SRVLYRSERGGHGTLRIKSVDGGSADETLLALEGREIWQGVFSPDEKTIAFRTGTQAGADIWVRTVAGDTTLIPVAATAFEEHSPRFSPDGRWIAYVSAESGGFAVYIRRFPIAGTAIRVSLAHGEEPIWSRDGRALYYRAERELIRANLRTEPSLAVTTREVIFPDFLSFGGGRATYDISPGGREFIMNRGVSEGAHLVFVHDWLHEVRARLAAQE
ncbi:MAG TPA: hypothetical protein VMM79_17865, partial [Longimicrobiales bacterium]|nr:hypothetical protein [Longimicrobiales bacterium]